MAAQGQTEQIVQLLQQTISSDQNVRVPATQYLEELAAANLPAFLDTMSIALADEANPEFARQVAGLQIKNQLASKDEQKLQLFQERWLQLEQTLRTTIKQRLLGTLHTTIRSVGATAAQAVAAVAQAELPKGQWDDLVNMLLTNATDPASRETLKQATLETIGYICEEIDPTVLTMMANPILTAIVNNMRREEPSNGVKLAATNALLNSLEFVKKNFDVPEERNFIMQVVCDTTQAGDVRIVTRAFQCLVKIMTLYYDHMAYYMQQALFQLTLGAMVSTEEDVALQAVEFWSTVCDEELNIAAQLSEGQELTCHFFAKQALPHLCPALLSLMTKQEDTDDDDIWNAATAAAVCLGLMANVCGGEIVQHVMPFISQNITNGDWHYREAAVLAFGEIMDGPNMEDIAAICAQAIPVLANLLQDPSVHVKDSAAYAISRMCEFQASVVLQPDMLQPVVEALTNQITDVPRVAVNICWAFNNLLEAAYVQEKNKSEGDVMTYPLSPMYQVIVTHLLQTINRQDAGMANLRYAAFEALNQAIMHAPEDCYAVVQNTTLFLINQLQTGLQFQSGVAQAEKLIHSEIQGLLCGSLQAAIQRLQKQDVLQIAQQVMAMFIYMLQSSAGLGGVQEDTLLAINSLLNELEQDFLVYVDGLLNPLMGCLQNFRESGVCSNAVGIVGDLARVMQANFATICRPIMEVLLGAVMDASVDRQVKVAILSSIGDIATAVGTHFSTYLEYTLSVLDQASAMAFIEAADYETEDYVQQLKENILEGYQGIVVGLRGENRPWHAEVYQLKDVVPRIVQFIQRCQDDQLASDMLIRASVGLLGDLCDVFGADIKGLVDQPWVKHLILAAKQSDNASTKRTANWAAKTMKEYSGVQ